MAKRLLCPGDKVMIIDPWWQGRYPVLSRQVFVVVSAKLETHDMENALDHYPYPKRRTQQQIVIAKCDVGPNPPFSHFTNGELELSNWGQYIFFKIRVYLS